jgi:hypothetical protein
MSQNIVPQNLNEEFVQEQVVQEVVQEQVVQEQVVQEVMDPETDCNVCFTAIETRWVGHNCDHELCETCFLRIIETSDKCPMCREQLSYIPPKNIIIQNSIQYNINNQYIHNFTLNTFNYDDLRQIEIIFESEI